MRRFVKRAGLYTVLAADYCVMLGRRFWKRDISDHGFWLDVSSLGHYFDEPLAESLRGGLANKTVLDLGCGQGKYVAFLKRAGINCRGYDGNPATADIPDCAVANLAAPLELEPADWVISLEVGEHIPVEFEQIFLDNISRHAREGIILSWALPRQPGRGHVNCRPNDFIRQEMYKRGFQPDEPLEARLRSSAWLPWFTRTLMAFRK